MLVVDSGSAAVPVVSVVGRCGGIALAAVVVVVVVVVAFVVD